MAFSCDLLLCVDTYYCFYIDYVSMFKVVKSIETGLGSYSHSIAIISS